MLGTCEECGCTFEVNLNFIQCPKCKSVYNPIKVVNDPDNIELFARECKKQSIITVKLTTKQYELVAECIERVSANEREFDAESELTLKEVAEKFKAEYKELNLKECEE